MNSRVVTAVGIAIVLLASHAAVAAQSSATLALVDVPIPVYPPIAQSALISGDVHVTVEVLPAGTVASATVARVEGFDRESTGLSSRTRPSCSGDLPVSGNPWTDDDKHLISLIRARIARHLGSDPPSRYELQLVEGVRQTYVAWYVDGNLETTAVSGLLFGDSNDARAFVELTTSTRLFRAHIVFQGSFRTPSGPAC